MLMYLGLQTNNITKKKIKNKQKNNYKKKRINKCN